VILPPCAWRQALHPGRDHRGRDEALELPVMRFDGGGAHAPLFCDDTLAAERDRRSPLLAFSDPPLSKAASPTSRHKALASSRPLAS
jgi:hypothetical protein